MLHWYVKSQHLFRTRQWITLKLLSVQTNAHKYHKTTSCIYGTIGVPVFSQTQRSSRSNLTLRFNRLRFKVDTLKRRQSIHGLLQWQQIICKTSRNSKGQIVQSSTSAEDRRLSAVVAPLTTHTRRHTSGGASARGHTLTESVTHIKSATNWSTVLLFIRLTGMCVTQRIVPAQRSRANLFAVHPRVYYFHECICRHCVTFIDRPEKTAALTFLQNRTAKGHEGERHQKKV